jgi:cobalamin biosynthesis protein CobT
VNPDDPFGRVRRILFGDDDAPSTYRRLTWSGNGTSNNKPGRETKKMKTKNLYVVTMPATVTVVAEGADAKDATGFAIKSVEAVLGKSLGILHVVGDAKATPVTTAKAGKKSAPKDDDEDEKDDEEEEEESSSEDEEEEEEDEDEDEDEEEEEEEEEDSDEDEEEEQKTSKKKDKKADKKADKSEGKKKIKIKLKG